MYLCLELCQQSTESKRQRINNWCVLWQRMGAGGTRGTSGEPAYAYQCVLHGWHTTTFHCPSFGNSLQLYKKSQQITRRGGGYFLINVFVKVVQHFRWENMLLRTCCVENNFGESFDSINSGSPTMLAMVIAAFWLLPIYLVIIWARTQRTQTALQDSDCLTFHTSCHSILPQAVGQ